MFGSRWGPSRRCTTMFTVDSMPPEVYACCHKKRDGSFQVQWCAWPHSAARVGLLLFAVNPPDIGRSTACFFCCRDTLIVPRFVHISVMWHWILCALCVAIIATKGLGLHFLCTLYTHCYTHTHTHTHTRLTALFRDYPGEPVPER